jgi:putative PIN family toxin of toxin-antitoxin system
MTSVPASGLRVVLDTNVYISALAYPQRPLAEIWRQALRRRYVLLVAPALINEVGRILRTLFQWDDAHVLTQLQLMVKVAEVIVPTVSLQVIAEDPADDRVLECALAGHADLIVSGDRHLRRLRHYQHIPIVRPVDFLRMLGT